MGVPWASRAALRARDAVVSRWRLPIGSPSSVAAGRSLPGAVGRVHSVSDDIFSLSAGLAPSVFKSVARFLKLVGKSIPQVGVPGLPDSQARFLSSPLANGLLDSLDGGFSQGLSHPLSHPVYNGFPNFSCSVGLSTLHRASLSTAQEQEQQEAGQRPLSLHLCLSSSLLSVFFPPGSFSGPVASLMSAGPSPFSPSFWLLVCPPSGTAACSLPPEMPLSS